MLDLPKAIIQVLHTFEPVFSERVREWAKILMVGAILTPGQRTVTAALRVMGWSGERQYQNYHRVLNPAVWSSRSLSERLLRQIVATFVAAEVPLVNKVSIALRCAGVKLFSVTFSVILLRPRFGQ